MVTQSFSLHLDLTDTGHVLIAMFTRRSKMVSSWSTGHRLALLGIHGKRWSSSVTRKASTMVESTNGLTFWVDGETVREAALDWRKFPENAEWTADRLEWTSRKVWQAPICLNKGDAQYAHWLFLTKLFLLFTFYIIHCIMRSKRNICIIFGACSIKLECRQKWDLT